MKKGWNLNKLFIYGHPTTEEYRYGVLQAAILHQAITDYAAATKAIYHGTSSKSWMRHWYKMRNECLEFFTDPQLDFGDIDTRKVLEILNEQIAEDLKCVS